MRIGKKQTKGAALVEYGILVGLIAVLAIVAVLNLGTTVKETFTTVSSTLSDGLASARNAQSGGPGAVVDPLLEQQRQCEESGGVWINPNCAF